MPQSYPWNGPEMIVDEETVKSMHQAVEEQFLSCIFDRTLDLPNIETKWFKLEPLSSQESNPSSVKIRGQLSSKKTKFDDIDWDIQNDLQETGSHFIL